jgi:hypothetical protein
MKIIFNFCIVALFGVKVMGQEQQAVTIPAPTPYTIVSRDGNSQVWQRTIYDQGPSGQVVAHYQQYTEMATGLNFKDPATGQWVPSQEVIDILPDGSAAATNGQHQVYFPEDIYNGVIKLVMPDGTQLQSQPVGLSYDDGSNTVMIAELRNSIGQLISPNQVIYTNAFTGLDADLLYTYTKAGFEQDVILNEQPPAPEYYGLNPQTAQLQVLTEFFNPPQPTIITTPLPEQAGVALTDDTLGFGMMNMIQGRAFLLGTNIEDEQATVGKQWLSLDGRHFLIEEVPMAAIADELSELPPPQTSSVISHFPLNVVSAKRLLPLQRLAKAINKHSMQVAQTGIPPRGFLLDYQTVNSSQTNFTFQGDMTYYISGAEFLYGTNTFEGGAVIKYPAFPTGSSLTLNGSINWLADAYRPVIFTAKDDNSVGQTISGSTGSPSGEYAYPQALLINSSVSSISNFRFTHIYQAFKFASGVPVNLYNGELYECVNGIGGSGYENLRNILFFGGTYAFNMNSATVTVQNATIADNNLNFSGSTPENFQNCIFAEVSTAGAILTGSFNGFYETTPFGTGAITNHFFPFQAILGAKGYLTNNCAFRNAGTNDLDPTLLAYLQTKTTYAPPIIYSSNSIFPVATNLGPRVFRDTSTTPDLGYHYDPLDYVFDACTISNNVAFSAGTAAGWYPGYGGGSSQPYGICLKDGANLSFNGNATQPCIYVWIPMVQENGNYNLTNANGVIISGTGNTPVPQLSSDFTKWIGCNVQNVLSGGSAFGQAGFLNSEFYSAGLASYLPVICFSNCLFFRDLTDFYDQYTNSSFIFQDCTFYNGGLAMARTNTYPASTWIIQNTSFDGTCFTWEDYWNGTTNTLFNYNAYNTNNFNWITYGYLSPPTNGVLETNGMNDVMVTNYNWESSWFGNFYLPTNSPLLLAGSTTADKVGLYHFTTQTNQVPDGTNIVTIGYHYVATDQYGNPLDSNGDGIPDYLEDANGDGLFDGNETADWQISPYGLNGANTFQVFTPLK